MQRVHSSLSASFGETYGLLFVFTMRTAVELHRAWHMTLLTSNILQQVKDKFGLRMTWNLGVVRLKFRVEDGGFELHRKVPYDYDSEYQDIYYRIAVALIEGHITVHEALLYQDEAKRGDHTARSGRFLRDFPGRLVLYPVQAATCAVIFFGGRWIDAAVAAICGLAAGLIEYALSYGGNQIAKVLTDVVVGISTGIIGGLWYNYESQLCLASVFLGTLYWFFYGTAFVIGLLEIIAGELETGVTRFVAVSVKTFVLSLGASIGLMISSGGGASKIWRESDDFCQGSLVGKWWRIPIYLACCVGVLGQYRMPLDRYWLGMLVQLAAYEVQFQVYNGMDEDYTVDHLDTAISNIAGAAAGVFSAYAFSWVINICRDFYIARLFKNEQSSSRIADFIYKIMRCLVKSYSCLGIGRKSDSQKLELSEKLKEQQRELNDATHDRSRMSLSIRDEELFLEAIVGAQEINIWSILMPAVYQLVPGSVIARFWFYSIFPPRPEDKDASQESVFSNLMVISTSLALGLIAGFALVQIFVLIWGRLRECCCNVDKEKIATRKRRQKTTAGMYTADDDDDPCSIHLAAE
ncbi:hypothetical protein ACHAXR_012882 [Thalassiosira sp. AJA248-18]